MINWDVFLFNFVIIFLQILIIAILLRKSSKTKVKEETTDIEIQIKYLALYHFKQYMNMKMIQLDVQEIEDYLVESIMLDCDYEEEEIRKVIKPFVRILMKEFKF